MEKKMQHYVTTLRILGPVLYTQSVAAVHNTNNSHCN